MNWAYEPLAREIARRSLLAGAPLDHHELVITVVARKPSISACAPSRARGHRRPGNPAYFGFLDIIQSLNLKALEIPPTRARGSAWMPCAPR